MNTNDFLVEIGTEELPPKALLKLSESFASGLTAGLKQASLSFQSVQTFATPRRLAVVVLGLSLEQPNSKIEKIGPALKAAYDADGEPTRAATGFASSCGVELGELGKIDKDGIEKLYYVSEKEGALAVTVLPELVKQALAQLPIPKRMRWGASRDEFVRPVHWCVLLLGSEVVDCELFGIKSGSKTRGHRFHNNHEIQIDSPASYESTLEDKGSVIADFSKRRELIRNQVLAKASELNATAIMSESLLDEVTALVEWPEVLAGNFEPSFLKVPSEALILAMQSHQKYFCLVDSEGNLVPSFISIANIRSKDPAQVVAGNEKVIRPRLADARFFYETDLKQPLESRLAQLRTIVFQEKLGSVFDKTNRVQALAIHIAQELGANPEYCGRAAALAKCDLVTNMVGEFADLQGLMGSYYAKAGGEPDEVAQAIREQYLPRYAGDQLPRTKTGQVLSIAEKLDTMCGLFSIGQPPTGSKDPFAIRRAALGILRILVESSIDLDIRKAIEFSVSQFKLEINQGEVANQVFDFLFERFRAWYQDQSIASESFLSVSAVRPTSPLDFDRRVQAVNEFTRLKESASLAAANKRVSNLLDKQNWQESNTVIDPGLFELEAEKVLFNAIQMKAQVLDNSLSAGDYKSYLSQLAELEGPVDAFFKDVLVVSDDLAVRHNRLALLAKLRQLFIQVADISFLHSSAS
jgi:glycyl-tRNA synthetase beta chain